MHARWNPLAGVFAHLLTASFLIAAAFGPAAAQKDISDIIERRDFVAIQIAVPDASARERDLSAAREIVETIRDDLAFSGYFEVVSPSLYRLVPGGAEDAVRYEDWVSIGANALLQLDVRVDGGRVDLQARLYDNESRSLLRAWRYGGTDDLVRLVAHKVSDELVKHSTGRPGVAQTRIAFVSRHGDGKEIYLMDYDGRRLRRLTTTGVLNLSPVWSPRGDELAFVSWRGRQPGVYAMSAEGKLGHLRTVGGELSSAPDWAPDGNRLVYTSDIDGNMEIYLLDRTSAGNARLTRNPGIDTSPAFSPNGREIAFTSDRTGSPQIYIMGVDGLNVRRVSWGGGYNESAAWSPNGDQLAYASRVNGRFEIVVLELATETTRRLTWGEGNNEDPGWSPDGRHIVFASDRAAGRYDIYTMRFDGSHVRRLTRGRDSFTPDWSP